MDEVVKIDSELMRKIEKLLDREKFLYANKKQVVNLAIIEFLNKVRLNSKGDNQGKLKNNSKKRRLK